MTTIKTEHGHKIEFNQEKHVYIHNNEYVVGMSTILGKLASPMLENWKIANLVNAIKQEMERQGIVEQIVKCHEECDKYKNNLKYLRTKTEVLENYKKLTDAYDEANRKKKKKLEREISYIEKDNK